MTERTSELFSHTDSDQQHTTDPQDETRSYQNLFREPGDERPQSTTDSR